MSSEVGDLNDGGEKEAKKFKAIISGTWLYKFTPLGFRGE